MPLLHACFSRLVRGYSCFLESLRPCTWRLYGNISYKIKLTDSTTFGIGVEDDNLLLEAFQNSKTQNYLNRLSELKTNMLNTYIPFRVLSVVCFGAIKLNPNVLDNTSPTFGTRTWVVSK